MGAEEAKIRIALAQVNPVVGDVERNAKLIREAIAEARATGAQIVVLPELCLTGYPPEDLLLKRDFLAAGQAALEGVATDVEGIVALIGFAEANGAVHNALAAVAEGTVRGIYRKMLLPNYGVFDERRYFEPGPSAATLRVNGVLVGLTICEDIWMPGGPAAREAMAGAALIVNASASPYHRGKGHERERMLAERCLETGAAFALCNAVGGQDELVFDGHSVVADQRGEVVARGAQFMEEILVCDLDLELPPDDCPEGARPEVPVIAEVEVPAPTSAATEAPLPDLPGEEAEVYEALKLGLRDYVRKNGFERVVLGLSGGVDSAVVATIAADALGAERVVCVVMPSPHSSAETQEDARRLASNLGVELIKIPIADAMSAYSGALSSHLDGGPGVTEENLQARIRGNLVMALSNRHGWLVLTTGNKSELSVGYATLYGDMAGGFSLIKDVPKTLVYRLARHRNRDGEPIPASILERAPSAELRPNQRDEDILPPYEVLDRILEAYVERDLAADEIVAEGTPANVVAEVLAMVDLAEYKRRQTPPGVKITPKAFGRDRRLPITNRFRAQSPLPPGRGGP